MHARSSSTMEKCVEQVNRTRDSGHLWYTYVFAAATAAALRWHAHAPTSHPLVKRFVSVMVRQPESEVQVAGNLGMPASCHEPPTHRTPGCLHPKVVRERSKSPSLSRSAQHTGGPGSLGREHRGSTPSGLQQTDPAPMLRDLLVRATCTAAWQLPARAPLPWRKPA